MSGSSFCLDAVQWIFFDTFPINSETWLCVSWSSRASPRCPWAPGGFPASGGWCEQPGLHRLSSFLQPVGVQDDPQCSLLIRVPLPSDGSSSSALAVFGDREASVISPPSSPVSVHHVLRPTWDRRLRSHGEAAVGFTRGAHKVERLCLVLSWPPPPFFH